MFREVGVGVYSRYLRTPAQRHLTGTPFFTQSVSSACQDRYICDFNKVVAGIGAAINSYLVANIVQ